MVIKLIKEIIGFVLGCALILLIFMIPFVIVGLGLAVIIMILRLVI